MKRIIRLTESDLTRIVRRVIREQEKGLTGGGKLTGDEDFSSVINSLKTFNIPKVIYLPNKGEPMTTLNWGKMSDRGKNKSWGYSIDSEGYQSFLSTDPRESKLFQMIMKQKTNKHPENYNYNGPLDSTTAVSKVKELINGLNNMA